jgi:hypothetical protein
MYDVACENCLFGQYELLHLKDFFNKTLIDVCKSENSRRLHELADRYKLDKAMKDIEEFKLK